MEQPKLLTELHNRFFTLSKAQQKAADYVLKDPLGAAFATIEHLSRCADVSTATITRLAGSLGYSGYAEFQSALQSCVQQELSPAKRLEDRLDSLNNSNIDELESGILRTLFDGMQETVNMLDLTQVRELVRRLSAAEAIYVTGSRSCFSVAHYLSYNINRIMGNCRMITPSDSSFAEELNRIRPGDVFIAFTLPRYVRSVIVASRVAKINGAYTVAITDSYCSPLVAESDMFLRVQYKSFDFHNTVVPSFIVAELIISLLTSSDWERARETLRRCESTWAKLDIHVNNDPVE